MIFHGAFWIGFFVGGLVAFVGLSILTIARDEYGAPGDEQARWDEIKRGMK
jgi:hypothetical protein